MDYALNFAAVWRSFDKLLHGLGLSLLLAAGAIAIGIAIGLVLGFALVSRRAAARRLAGLYVTVIRNTPILVLVLFVYFALPDLGVQLEGVASFVLTLALYSGAYLAEVFRAGLLSVPVGLREAGQAIGLTRWQINASIVGPLMLRNALPALGSTVISLFKDTSLAAVIAVPELTFEARKINIESFRVVETWIVASLLYVATCTLLGALLRRFERRLAVPR
ncbi:MAG TPA: amino acid ABC transporter permease [Burkholderiaceae bacterium]